MRIWLCHDLLLQICGLELRLPSQKNAAVATAIIHGNEIPSILLLFCHFVCYWACFYGFLFLWFSLVLHQNCLCFFFSNYSQNPWILPSWDTHQNWPVFCLCHWPYFSGVISGHPKDLQCWFWSTHGSLVLFQVNPLFVYHDTDLWSLFFVVISCVVFLLHTSWSIFL